MRIFMLLPSAFVLLAAAPAPSGRPPVASQIAPQDDQQALSPPTGGGLAAKSQADEKKICRQLPSSTSRLRNRACLTAKEWQMVEDDLSR